ncbi:MAG: glycosyltransferase family 4 protein [candidate division WOR-3 bacterium]|jgi:phosphatidylinositol alpha-mannosyltransferase
MNKKLNILLVSAAYRPYPSGVSEHVYHLAKNLHALGNEVTVLATNFPRFKNLQQNDQESFRVERVGRAILLPLNRSYATLPIGLKLPGQVAEFLRRNQFDIVHCHGLFWPEISYWAINYSPAINLITFLTAGFKIHTAGRGLFKLIFRNQIKKIHGRIAISNRARMAIEPYLPGEYRIIPSGVDLNKFKPGLSPAISGQREKTILFLGRLDRRKGIEVIIQAMPEILKFHPNTRLVVAGEGPMKSAAMRLVKKLGLEQKVHFIGAVRADDRPGYYCRADVFCSPALGGETLGIVLLEAMACGTPVVASDIPGYDETVAHLKDGILFPRGNTRKLAESIIRVLKDQNFTRQLINNGLQKVKNYDWQLIAKRTLDYYYELLDKRCQLLGKFNELI